MAFLHARSHPLSSRPSTSIPTGRLIAAAVLVTAAALLALWLTSRPTLAGVWPRWGAALALAWWVPGALLTVHWRLPDLDLPSFLVIALGLGLGWMMGVLLLLHWLPGPLAFEMMVLAYAGGALLLAAGLMGRPPLVLAPTSVGRWLWLLALLLIACALRLPGLGYHEFHYDEVLVLTRAREAIRGEDDALARHTKGPGEIAVAAVVFRTLGTADEATARLPFGLASVAGVLALALLGRQLFMADAAGFWSGLLLALNGFVLGLARIVQYQAAVLLLMILAVMAAWRFAQSGALRWIVLSAVLSAWGLVLHYEFGLVAPALLYLLVVGWPNVVNKRRALGQLLVVTAGGTLLVLAVYLPLYVNAYFAQTQGYLDTRLGRLGSTFNLPFFIEMGTFYNSIYYFAGLLLLAAAGVVIGWRRQRRATLTLILWFSPFLLLYLFIVQFPGTHFYLLMPSWALLGGVTLARLLPGERGDGVTGDKVTGDMVMHGEGRWRWVAGTLVCVWMGVSAYYLYLMFFRQEPEYLVNYASERVPFYWAPYGENVPEKPRFGFPIYEGWKTLGVLSEWKYLNGTYASNERSRHLRWYLGDFERVPLADKPDFVFVARHLQEPDPAYDANALASYAKIGDVTVRGEPRIEIWARETLPVHYVSYDAAAFDAIFMGLPPTFEEWPDPPPSVQDVSLSNAVTLHSGGFAPQSLAPGDVLHVLLVWQANEPLAADYKRFLHIADDEGRPVAQFDGLPGFDTGRTSTWTPGETFDDHMLFVIPEGTPSGRYRVITGLYNSETGERVGEQIVELGELSLR